MTAMQMAVTGVERDQIGVNDKRIEEISTN